MLLTMYSNRANAAWAERQKVWSPGQAIGVPEQLHFRASEEFTVYKADLVRKLRLGQVGH